MSVRDVAADAGEKGSQDVGLVLTTDSAQSGVAGDAVEVLLTQPPPVFRKKL